MDRLIRIAPWVASSRPKTLVASLIPVAVAAVLAVSEKLLDLSLAIRCFFIACFVQIAANLFNDYCDYKKGSDTEKRLGPKRALHTGALKSEEVFVGAIACILIALALAIPIFMLRGWWLSPIAIVCVLMAYLYTGGPYALAYLGLGELFVMIFFGWIATFFSYYAITGKFSMAAFVAGTQIGCLSMSLITINNIRDENEDRQSRKNTLVVKYGRNFGFALLSAEFLFPQVLQFYWMPKRFFLFPIITLPLAFTIVRSMWAETMSERSNRFLAFSSLHALLFTICWSLAILLYAA